MDGHSIKLQSPESVVALASVLVLASQAESLCRDVAVTSPVAVVRGGSPPSRATGRHRVRALIRAGRAAAAAPQYIEASHRQSSCRKSFPEPRQLSVVVGFPGAALHARPVRSPHRAVSTCPCGNVRVSGGATRGACSTRRCLWANLHFPCRSMRWGNTPGHIHHGEENNRDLRFHIM